MPEQPPQPIRHERLEDDGTFPNNQELPVLIYTSAFDAQHSDLADRMEQTFRQNKWTGAWRNGIYSYHHYHSTAHEVLGVYRGSVNVQLGGPEGINVDASAGDVLVLPAGTAHKNKGSSSSFRCIGAYPSGQDWDMNYGKENERPAADQNIQQVPLPEQDPVHGKDGPLIDKWKVS
jgi:uncharacterized protein YjlB